MGRIHPRSRELSGSPLEAAWWLLWRVQHVRFMFLLWTAGEDFRKDTYATVKRLKEKVGFSFHCIVLISFLKKHRWIQV